MPWFLAITSEYQVYAKGLGVLPLGSQNLSTPPVLSGLRILGSNMATSPASGPWSFLWRQGKVSPPHPHPLPRTAAPFFAFFSSSSRPKIEPEWSQALAVRQ